MAMSKKVEDAINEQINKELYSSYLYLSMEAYFDSANLKGFANWMRVQALEEITHAMKFFDHVSERGGRVLLSAIEKPKIEWKSALEAFSDAYDHEVFVTGRIHMIADLAEKEKDRATLAFLQWLIDEQVEEEASALDIKLRLEMVKDNPAAIFMIDQELAQRMFTNSAGIPSSIQAKKTIGAKGGA